MTAQSYINLLLGLGGLVVLLVAGRNQYRKQLIETLKDLVESLGTEVDRLTKRVRFLEDLLWNSHLVDPGAESGGRGRRRGGGAASAAPPEDEGDG